MAVDRAKVERDLEIHEQLENLSRAVAQLGEKSRNGGAEFTPDERKEVRKLLKKNEFVERLRRLARTVCASAGATLLFFLAFGEYIRAIFSALRAAFR